MQPSDFLTTVRWLAAKNNDAGEMPAHAVVVVSSSGTEGQFVLTKPTEDSEHAWIAGPVPALAGDGATATNDFPAWALYDDGDGTPAVGEEWGAGASSWKLRKGKTGFRVCGTPDTTLKVVPVERSMVAAAGGGELSMKNMYGSSYNAGILASSEQGTGYVVIETVTPLTGLSGKVLLGVAGSVNPNNTFSKFGFVCWDSSNASPDSSTDIVMINPTALKSDSADYSYPFGMTALVDLDEVMDALSVSALRISWGYKKVTGAGSPTYVLNQIWSTPVAATLL